MIFKLLCFYYLYVLMSFFLQLQYSVLLDIVNNLILYAEPSKKVNYYQNIHDVNLFNSL